MLAWSQRLLNKLASSAHGAIVCKLLWLCFWCYGLFRAVTLEVDFSFSCFKEDSWQAPRQYQHTIRSALIFLLRRFNFMQHAFSICLWSSVAIYKYINKRSRIYCLLDFNTFASPVSLSVSYLRASNIRISWNIMRHIIIAKFAINKATLFCWSYARNVLVIQECSELRL